MRSFFAALAVCLTLTHALLLDVPAGALRCLHEVLSRHDLVKGSFKLEPRDGMQEGERTPFEIRVSQEGRDGMGLDGTGLDETG